MVEITEVARARAAKLRSNYNWPDPAVFEDILALGDEAVPALAELLTPELLSDAQVEDDASTLVYYCVQLLGDLKRPAAIPTLVGLYAQFSDDDDIIEPVSEALHRIGPASIAALLTVVADPSLPYYPRMQASETVINLAGRDLIRRGQIAAALRPVLAELLVRPDPLSEDDRTVVAVLVSTLAEAADLSSRPLIDAAFEADRVGGEMQILEGLPEMPYITQEDTEKLFQEGGESVFRAAKPFLEEYRESYQEHLAKPPRPALPPPVTSQPAVFTARLGRNDPCWCGSGKKYKKCHLTQDEKEKVRL